MVNEESTCFRTFSAKVDDVEALSLVQECRELMDRYKSNFTSWILNAEEPVHGLQIIKEALDHYIIISSIKKDQVLLLAKVSTYQYLNKIAEYVGWKNL